MAKKLRNAVHGRRYSSNGAEKTKWTTIGSLIETDKGALMLKLDYVPIPDKEGNITIYFFKDEPKAKPQPAETEEAPF